MMPTAQSQTIVKSIFYNNLTEQWMQKFVQCKLLLAWSPHFNNQSKNADWTHFLQRHQQLQTSYKFLGSNHTEQMTLKGTNCQSQKFVEN